MLHIGNRFRYRGLRDRQIFCGFGHAPSLHDGEQNVQIAQLQSASDGHTLLFVLETPLTVSPWLHSKLGYHPFRDFTPIATAARFSLTLARAASRACTFPSAAMHK